MILMTLLLGLTSVTQAQTTKIEEGETFTATTQGVFVTRVNFIALVNAQEMVKYHRDRASRLVQAIENLNSDHEEVVKAKNAHIIWLGQEYEGLMNLYKDKPEESWTTALGRNGIAITAGFALCEAVR